MIAINTTRQWFLWFSKSPNNMAKTLFFVLTGFLLSGCVKQDVCRPGDTEVCRCNDGSSVHRLCAANGDSWSRCTCDSCPNDPAKDQPGICGCGLPDVDTDRDGIMDCVDNCPDTPNPDQTDTDGDGIGDICQAKVDSDQDGIVDEAMIEPIANPAVNARIGYPP